MTNSIRNNPKQGIFRPIWNKLVFAFIILISWQIGAYFYHNPIILPAPLDVIISLEKIILNGTLFSETITTFSRGVTGVFFAFLIGIIIGILMGVNKTFHYSINPLIVMLQSTPVISWLLLALIWFDNRIVPLFIIIISTGPVIIINVSEGIKRTDPKLLEMAKLYQVKKGRIIRDIYIPSIAGYIVSSLKIVFSLAYRTAVMAEVLAHPGNGIGEKMSWARINVETADIISWTFVIIGLAVLTNKLFSRLSDKINRQWFNSAV